MSNLSSDLLLVERAGTVYKCRYDDFRIGTLATKGIVLAITRKWNYSYTTQGGQIYGVPSGSTWYSEGSTEFDFDSTGMTAITSQNYGRRPNIQFYCDNIGNWGNSGWSDWVVPYNYLGEYDSYWYINGGSGSGYTSVLNLFNYSAQEIQGAIDAPHATISKIRFNHYSGYTSAQYGGTDFKIGYKLIDDTTATSFITTKYSGTTGGTFITFGDYGSSDGSTVWAYDFRTSGYKDFTSNQYNIAWT